MYNGTDKKAFDLTGSALDNALTVMFTGIVLATAVIGIVVAVVITRLLLMSGTIGVFDVVASLVVVVGKDIVAVMDSVFIAVFRVEDELEPMLFEVVIVEENVIPVLLLTIVVVNKEASLLFVVGMAVDCVSVVGVVIDSIPGLPSFVLVDTNAYVLFEIVGLVNTVVFLLAVLVCVENIDIPVLSLVLDVVDSVFIMVFSLLFNVVIVPNVMFCEVRVFLVVYVDHYTL